MIRFAALLFVCAFSPLLWAVEVSSIVSCKAEGETWLCAAYENDQIQVFRSDHYQTKVEFKGALKADLPPAAPATAPINPAAVDVSMPETEGLPMGSYTIQLLACSALQCEERLQKLQAIPGSQVVEMKVQDRLLHALIVGGYSTYKEAQQAAGELITRYQLQEKPWIRTLDSVRSHMLEP